MLNERGERKTDKGSEVLHRICVSIWSKREWPEDWVRSLFVPIPNKGNTMEYGNNRTISLIVHASKVILKIISNRLKNKLELEVSIQQAGFQKSRGTRDQLFNLKQIIEKQREYNQDFYICFIDYIKAFDKGRHKDLWRIMTKMGFPHHWIELIRSLYEQQQAAVKTSPGITEWFEIGQGARQGYILSPYLFNIFSEMIMREALKDFEGSIKIGGRIVRRLEEQ